MANVKISELKPPDKKGRLALQAVLFWRKFAAQTYPAGEFKSRRNPAKVPPANIPFLAGNKRFCILFVNTRQLVAIVISLATSFL